MSPISENSGTLTHRKLVFCDSNQLDFINPCHKELTLDDSDKAFKI